MLNWILVLLHASMLNWILLLWHASMFIAKKYASILSRVHASSMQGLYTGDYTISCDTPVKKMEDHCCSLLVASSVK